MNRVQRNSQPFCRSFAGLSLLAALLTAVTSGTSPGDTPKTAAGLPAEADIAPFLGEPKFEVQPLFTSERFPNVVVALDGTVVATWGSKSYRVRRSEDGGATWGPEIMVAEPGFQGGGALVDERSGDILVFVEAGHPPAPLAVYRSSDQGKTWRKQEVVIHPDENGHL
ncbi:MAG: sialidase family protein, partial [Patescibacteria group bacterium]|nr:sialidase family protein [Patescibacteria group bacterium]